MSTVISVLQFHLNPETLDEGLPALRAVLDQTRAFPGSEGVDVAQSVSDPGLILVVEKWTSLDDDTAYRAWRQGDGATPELQALMPHMTAAPDTVIANFLPEV